MRVTLQPGDQVSTGQGWFALTDCMDLEIAAGAAVGIEVPLLHPAFQTRDAFHTPRVVMLHPATYKAVWPRMTGMTGMHARSVPPADVLADQEIGGCAGCGAKFYEWDEAHEHQCPCPCPGCGGGPFACSCF